MPHFRVHWWSPTAVVLVVVYAVVALTLPAGFAASTFGNLVQTALLLAFFVLTAVNASRTHGRTRQFWGSIALGAALWLAATLLWVWYEVILGREVPVAFLGDVLFFVHMVPMMGALGARAHLKASRRLEFATLDFTLLLSWWVYLYGFLVIPWQYVVPDSTRYSSSFYLLYSIESLALIAALAWLTVRVRGPWRATYARFLAAASAYAIASCLVNKAIESGRYHTGSLYDILLVVAMCLFIHAALKGMMENPEPEQVTNSRLQTILLSRMAMVAVLSLPFIGMVGMTIRGVPHRVTVFRLFWTLLAMVLLPFVVFLKQHLLDRELVRSLGASQHNYENLKRLQAQLVQAEKLSALSQFVAGAAHQINNPLTAVLGYADLLEHDCPPDDQRAQWAIKIGQQARRTQEMVKNLLSFAKQAHGDKTLIAVNPLVANAIELRELDLRDASIRIKRQFDARLPQVLADGNQLLQVCFHIIGNAIDALKTAGGGLLTVSTRSERDYVVIEFEDNGPGVEDPKKIFDPFYTTKPAGKGAGLGLSACYGIVSEHGGTILCDNRPEGGASFTVRLPVAGREQPRSGAMLPAPSRMV